MPAFHIQRTQSIQAPIEKVFDLVRDYDTWTTWSPWLRIDPEASVKTSSPANEVGSTYDWEGEVVGAGGMTQRSQEPPTREKTGHLLMDLVFLKPFKSSSRVEFDLVPRGDHCDLTWHMHGKLPVFLFWMKSSLERFVGMDYERGLKMIRQLAETGQVHSRLEVLGVQDRSASKLFGVADSCRLDEMAPRMADAFEKAKSAVDSAGAAGSESGGAADSPIGETASLYLPTSDLKKMQMDFVSGFLCKQENEDEDADAARLQRHDLVGGRHLGIRHTGPYENLGNAWSGIHQYARYKKLKLAKQPSIEIYKNDPSATEPEDLVTEIWLPLKG